MELTAPHLTLTICVTSTRRYAICSAKDRGANGSAKERGANGSAKDRGANGSASYVDYLCHVHKEICNLLS